MVFIPGRVCDPAPRPKTRLASLVWYARYILDGRRRDRDSPLASLVLSVPPQRGVTDSKAARHDKEVDGKIGKEAGVSRTIGSPAGIPDAIHQIPGFTVVFPPGR